MYWFFSGTVLALTPPVITIKVEGTGLGFEIFASPALIASVRIWESTDIWVHHHKTDVSETLFGCIDPDERALFREFLKVNGVGGKTALNILGLGRESLMKAIQFEDDKLLASVPGIGKKTAQKIIVDLKGSIDFSKKSDTPTTQKNTSDMTLISSLTQMGYDKSRVESVIAGLDPSESLEVRTIQAIKSLAV